MDSKYSGPDKTEKVKKNMELEIKTLFKISLEQLKNDNLLKSFKYYLAYKYRLDLETYFLFLSVYFALYLKNVPTSINKYFI